MATPNAAQAKPPDAKTGPTAAASKAPEIKTDLQTLPMTEVEKSSACRRMG